MSKGDFIQYEWSAETVDRFGDVQSLRFEDRLAALLPLQEGERVALVKSCWVDTHLEGGEDLESRSYWHPQDGDRFCNGDDPPRIYLREHRKAHKVHLNA